MTHRLRTRFNSTIKVVLIISAVSYLVAYFVIKTKDPRTYEHIVLGKIKMIARAADSYRLVKRSYPDVNHFDTDGHVMYSWRVSLLPYINEDKLFDDFNRKKAWNSPDNMKILTRMPHWFDDGRSGEIASMDHSVFVGTSSMPPDQALMGDWDAGKLRYIVVVKKPGFLWTQPEKSELLAGAEILDSPTADSLPFIELGTKIIRHYRSRAIEPKN